MTRFGFNIWPFASVPTPQRGATLWADRAAARQQIAAIFSDWSLTSSSTITLMWADLGAGKTHTLYHIEDLCTKQLETLIPCYVLLPTSIHNFVELYRAIAGKLNWEMVGPGLPLSGGSRTARNLSQAVRWRSNTADPTRRLIAERWLDAERLTGRECSAIGVTRSIATVDDAVEVLTHAVHAIAAPNRRVVLMIDEYQRVAEGNRRQLQEVGHGIHTLFNACPSGLGLILSCATGMASDYESVLTREVVSRLSQKRIDLPYLEIDDIRDYVRDLFLHYRPGTDRDPFFPLTEESTVRFANFLVHAVNGEVTARRLNEAFHELVSSVYQSGVHVPVDETAVEQWIRIHGARLVGTLGA